jgi:ribosomal protein L9
MQEDPTACGYIKSERYYEKDLHNKKFNKDEADLKQQVGETKQEVGEMKHQLSQMRAEIEFALHQIWDMKKHKSVDMNAIVMALAVGLVLGMLVTVMLK